MIGISEYDVNGDITERHVLELGIKYKKEGQDKEHSYTIIYDPEMNDSEKDDKKRITYFPKADRRNYRVKKLKKGIEQAYKHSKSLDLSCAMYDSNPIDLIEIGAVEKGSAVFKELLTGAGQQSVGLPRPLSKAILLSTKFIVTSPTNYLELAILCTKKDNSKSIRYVLYDGEKYRRSDLQKSISIQKGFVLDLLVYQYLQARNDHKVFFQPRKYIMPLTGECREPNIVLPRNNWIHIKSNYYPQVPFWLMTCILVKS